MLANSSMAQSTTLHMVHMAQDPVGITDRDLSLSTAANMDTNFMEVPPGSVWALTGMERHQLANVNFAVIQRR